MSTYATPTVEGTDTDRQHVALVETGGGLLVYAIEREYRPHLGRETEVARRLIGFADVTDWDAIGEAARARGHSHGDVLHLPILGDVTRRSD